MPSLRTVLTSFGAASFLSQTPILQSSPSASVPNVSPPFSLAHSCPADGPVSCHNTTASQDSCCFVYPGGQLLQTQFWDTRPSIGPNNSWTLHGLWPDLCDGTYEQFCHHAPHYYNITKILTEARQIDLLDDMNKYWLPNSGTAERFWQHEWNKHGTCINTLSPSCYGADYSTGVEVVDFFVRTVELFKSLDTFAALKEGGIVPSTTKTYTNVEIQAALSVVTGSSVVLGCQRGALNQVWYAYNVKGSIQTGEFVPTDPSGSVKGTCPSRGIKYWPKE